MIPAGTRISTINGTTGPVMITTTDTLCPAAASSASCSVVSLTSGASGNGAAGVFIQHNFTAYASSAFGSLLVTNNFGVVVGTDAETDTDYRYRINLKLQSPAGNAEANVRLAISLSSRRAGRRLRLPGRNLYSLRLWHLSAGCSIAAFYGAGSHGRRHD